MNERIKFFSYSRIKQKQYFRKLIFPVLLIISIICLSKGATAPIPITLISLPFLDKIIHLFIFGVLAILFFRIKEEESSKRYYAFFTIILSSLIGITDELVQAMNPYRYADVTDWIADTLGALIAVITYRNWKFFRNILEYKIVEF
jgi:glycopeptide antibiotics resistance protein